MYRALVVEDDPVIAREVENCLARWGIQAQGIEDFQDVLGAFARFAPHITLMDISLPFFNGYYWCERIRAVSKSPILFLSSASDNMNVIMAVNMGADDFIAKPFDSSVLAAKVRALLRRAYDFSGQDDLLARGGAVLDLAGATLTGPEGRTELTRNEFLILRLLMENPGRVVSREELMTRLWASDEFVDDNTLAVNVARLRKTLAGVGLPDFIATKKGMGYEIA